MPLFELTHESLSAVPRTTLQEQMIRERSDLQRLLKKQIDVLGEDLLILAEEFSQWEDSKRRVDLLALDSNGALVVIELKRTEDGSYMDLQAIRYAAMVSTLSFRQAVEAHARFLNAESSAAEAAILDFLGETEAPEKFGKKVRAILVSPDFSRELTTAVMWLNGEGLEIQCIRIRPYRLDQRLLLDIEQVIPLPEAQDYTVRIKEKQDEAFRAADSTVDFTRYDLHVGDQTFKNLWKRNLVWQVFSSAVKFGVTLDQLRDIIPARKMVVVAGHLRGEEFLAAAQQAREREGYVFQPKRLFIDDDHLIDIGDQTMAISNQWGLPSLPLINEIIALIPAAKISYVRSSDPNH